MEIFEALHSAAQNIGIPYFVIGAAARDLLFRYGYDLPVRRATRDIDIAVRVADWDQHDRLVGALIATGNFEPTEIRQRYLFKGSETIDIVPFGPIAGKKHSIAWPPDENVVMGVLGFEEAFRSAIPLVVRREPLVSVPVASLAGLAMMKLISWDESYPRRAKDGQDCYYITENYIDAGNDGRLYDEAADLLAVESFDRARAGARLLGRDMARLVEGDAKQKIREIIVRESDPAGQLKLISDIVGADVFVEEKTNDIFVLLQSVRDGFLEGRRSR